MKQLISILVLSFLIGQAYSLCSCSHLRHKADCEKEKKYCFWETEKNECQQKECSKIVKKADDNTKDEERIKLERACNEAVLHEINTEEKNYCYWTGSKCKSAKKCSDLNFEEDVNPVVCQSFGDCIWHDGKCKDPGCNDFKEKLECNSKYLSFKKTPEYCYFQDDTCKAAKSCEEIRSKESCKLHDCYWILEKCTTKQIEVNYDDIEDYPDCYTLTEEDECIKVSNLLFACQWYDNECYQVLPRSPCKDYRGYDNCPEQKCIWDSPNMKCIDKTCYDYKCTEPFVYTRQGSDFLRFCEKSKDGNCVMADATVLGEKKCYDMTFKQFAWTGTSCDKCYSLLMGVFFMLMMIML